MVGSRGEVRDGVFGWCEMIVCHSCLRTGKREVVRLGRRDAVGWGIGGEGTVWSRVGFGEFFFGVSLGVRIFSVREFLNIDVLWS